MVRAIERIERDIEALEAQVRAIAAELHANYIRYYTALGAAVRQQLILATYHLCTQGYPEAFLKLSLSQRQKLQQSIRQAGTDAAAKLMQYTQTDRDVRDNPDENSDPEAESKAIEASILESLSAVIVEAMGSSNQPFSRNQQEDDNDENPDLPTLEIANLPDFDDDDFSDSDFDDIASEIDLDNEDDEDDEDDEEDEEEDDNQINSPPFKGKQSLQELQQKFRQSRKIIIPGHLLRVLPFPSESVNPIDFIKWQQSIEFATQQAIKKISHEANLILQKSEILPKKLPESLLNVANAASDAATEVTSGPPNLLNVIVKLDGDKSLVDSPIAPIMLLNLRLGEIEFADSNVAHERKNLRNTTMQLQRIKREYQKKLKEKSVAEAEAAWRASWYEER